MAQMTKFNFPVEAVALDSGYFTGHICKKLHEEKSFMVMGYRSLVTKRMNCQNGNFYVKELDVFSCPMGCKLSYATTDREGYRHYKSNINDCAVCPLRDQSTISKNKQREITEHIWDPYKDIVRDNIRAKTGKELYKNGKFTIDGALLFQGVTWISICTNARGEVCPRAGISNRSQSKYEKNSPLSTPSKEKWSRWRAIWL